MNKGMGLSDNVIARIVQILQEGMVTGTDITDHMRMIRVEADSDGQLQLTEDYLERVRAGHDKFNIEMTEKMNSQGGES